MSLRISSIFVIWRLTEVDGSLLGSSAEASSALMKDSIFLGSTIFTLVSILDIAIVSPPLQTNIRILVSSHILPPHTAFSINLCITPGHKTEKRGKWYFCTNLVQSFYLIMFLNFAPICYSFILSVFSLSSIAWIPIIYQFWIIPKSNPSPYPHPSVCPIPKRNSCSASSFPISSGSIALPIFPASSWYLLSDTWV